MTTEWKLREGTGESDFFVTVDTPRMVALSVSEEEPRLMGIAGKIRELYRVGSWMAESFRDNSRALNLLCRSSRIESLKLEFQDGAVSLSVRPGGGWADDCPGYFEGALSLTLLPHQKIIVQTEGGNTRTRPEPVDAEPESPVEEPFYADNRQEEMERLREEVTRAHHKLNALEVQNQTLQDAIAQRMDREYFPYLQERTESLGEELRERIRRAEAEEARLNCLRQDLEAAKSMEEFRVLDIEQCERDLSELRLRLRWDEETAALMRNDIFFRGGTVNEALEKVRRALDDTEEQIRRVVQAREQFNRTVQDSILTGNGSVTSGERQGGANHGDGRAVEPENP